MTIYVSIGNSDDKLTQREWSDFFEEVVTLACGYASEIHGTWASASDGPYQNACVAFDVTHPANVEVMKRELSRLAAKYRQDSIAWAEAETEFLKPVSG